MRRSLRWLLPAGLLISLLVLAWWRNRSPAAPSDTGGPAMERPESRAGIPRPGSPPPPPVVPGRYRVEGIVLMPDGSGAPQATVTLSAGDVQRFEAETDGSFARDGLHALVYRVEARHGDLVGGPVWVRVTATVEPVVVRLRVAGTLEVEVTDEYGAPLPGARVEVGESQGGSDAQGHARVTGLAADTYSVRVSAERRAVVVQDVDVAAPGTTRVAVTLAPAVATAGVVVDEAGAPVASARVEARVVNDGTMWRPPVLATAVTSADGRWALAGLGAGTIVLAAAGLGRVSAPMHVTVSAQGTADIKLVLGSPRTLRGLVRSAGGAPADGALVRVLAKGELPGAAEPQQVLADASGRFEIDGLPPAEAVVVAVLDEASSAGLAVDLREQPLAEVELTLGDPMRIEGKVVDGDGTPVAEAQVVAVPVAPASPQEQVMRGPVADLTDGTGAFRLVGLGEGSYELRAAPPGASTSDSSFLRRAATVAKAGARDVEIRLPRDGRVVGRVTSADGGALAGIEVVLDDDGAIGGLDGDGRFAVDGVSPGSHSIEVRAAGMLPLVKAGLRVEAGQSLDLGTLVLSEGRTVRGTVRDEQGRPLGGARVVIADRVFASSIGNGVLDRLTAARVARTDARGEFAARGVAMGAQVLVASHVAAGVSPPYQVRAKDLDVRVDVVITPSGVLRGHVTSGGQGVAGATVLAATGGGGAQIATTRTSTSGAYRFDRLAAGVYSVTATTTGAGAITVAGTATVPAAGEVALDLHHVRGELTIDVLVPGASEGGAVVVARVEAQPDGTTRLGQVVIAESVDDTTYRAEGVHAGPAKICFVASDRTRTCSRHEILPSPPRQSFTLQLGGAP